jgi:hypothetical protein
LQKQHYRKLIKPYSNETHRQISAFRDSGKSRVFQARGYIQKSGSWLQQNMPLLRERTQEK